jgi:hypothetical protein
MRDDGENGRLGSPIFLPWPAARPAAFRLSPGMRLLGLSLRALGNLSLVFPALVCDSSYLVCSLIFMLLQPIFSLGKHQPMSRNVFERLFEA